MLIFAMRPFVLAFVSNELLPKRRVFIKTGSQRSRTMLSMFSMVVRRICLSDPAKFHLTKMLPR